MNKMNKSCVPMGFVFTTGKSVKEIITANLSEKDIKSHILSYSSSTKNEKDQKTKIKKKFSPHIKFNYLKRSSMKLTQI